MNSLDAISGVPDRLIASVHTKKEEVGMVEEGRWAGWQFQGDCKKASEMLIMKQMGGRLASVGEKLQVDSADDSAY